MLTPEWQAQTIGIFEGFTIKLEFESEDLNPKRHFIGDCGWSEDKYNEIKDYYWFCAKVVAFKGRIECGDAYLGACCHESLKSVIPDKNNIDTMLGGYMPQLIEEAITGAKDNLGA